MPEPDEPQPEDAEPVEGEPEDVEASEPDEAEPPPDEPEPDEDDKRLQELGEMIDKAREHAEDAFPVLEDDEPRFVDSGAEPDEDDETAPPG